jgi:nitroreductase
MKFLFVHIFLIILIYNNHSSDATEHVVFERIGQMSGATSFIHVHVTLGIGLLTQQVDKYRDLLSTTFNSKEAILELFEKQLPSYNTSSDANGKQLNSYYSTMAILWVKIAQQHKLDMLDAYIILASLKNTMPDLPDNEVKRISARSRLPNPRFDARDMIRLAEIAEDRGLDLSATIDTHRDYHHPEAETIVEEDVPSRKMITIHHLLSTLSSPEDLQNPPRPLLVRPELKAKAKTTRPTANNIVNGAPLVPLPHLRRRRDRLRRNLRYRRFAGAIALPMAVAATAMGIYNTDQINFLKKELGKLQDNQDRLFDVVYRHENMLEEISKAILETAAAMISMMIFNPALFDARLSRIENQIRTKLTKTTHALQAGLNRKLAVDYLTPTEVRSIFDELQITASKLKCDLLIEHHSSLFQLETSLLFDGSDAHLLIHVPMVPHQALLRLYKLHPIPLPLSDTYFLIPDVKNDVLAISANDNRFAIQLSSMDLLGCHRVNQLFMCDRFGVLAKGYNDTCLGSLYNQQFQAAQHLCKFEVAPITERVYQLKKHHFLVYLPQALTVPIKCRNGSTTEKHLSRGHQELFISPGCEAEFTNHRIMTDTSITFPADILHFEWQWDRLDVANFMDTTEIPAELSKLAEGGITRPTLADLQFLAITKQKIGEMVKPEDWGLSTIHTIGSGVLGIGVIIIIIYAAYRCYQWKFSTTSSASAPPPSGITIINAPTAPDRSASMESDNPAPHPLASTRYFRRSPRLQPRPPRNHRYSDQPVHFNVRDDDVILPYEAHHASLNRETLLLRRDDLITSLSTIDQELHQTVTTEK